MKWEQGPHPMHTLACGRQCVGSDRPRRRLTAARQCSIAPGAADLPATEREALKAPTSRRKTAQALPSLPA